MRKENEAEGIYEDIIAENFPEMMKDTDIIQVPKKKILKMYTYMHHSRTENHPPLLGTFPPPIKVLECFFWCCPPAVCWAGRRLGRRDKHPCSKWAAFFILH